MKATHFFLIESDRARNDLFLDGELIGTFPTHEAAEAKANRIANTSLKFELDLKSTLSNLEIRGATFDADHLITSVSR